MTVFEKMRMREKIISEAIKKGIRGEALRKICEDVERMYPVSDNEAKIWAEEVNWYERRFYWAKGKRL